MAEAGFTVYGGDISYRQWETDGGYSGNFYYSAYTYGHAFDVNPNENYCPNCNGGTVGNYYKPGEDKYSVTQTLIIFGNNMDFIGVEIGLSLKIICILVILIISELV